MGEKKPFHQENYKKENEHFSPFLNIFIGKTEISALADTGCSSGVSMFRDQIGELDLGEKINDEPIDVSVADGHLIGADVYLSKVDIAGKSKEVEICIVDPSIRGYRPEYVPPLVGRNLLDNFDVMFQGRKKRISLFHP